MTFTEASITDDQIRALRTRLGSETYVGASDDAASCEVALAAPIGSLRRMQARARCADILNAKERVSDLIQLVREYFAAKAAYERTDGGRWVNLKGAVRVNVRARDCRRFYAADEALRIAVGVDDLGKIKETP